MATSVQASFVTPLAAELAADVLERFLRYVRIDTRSESGHTGSPSTEKQLDLGRLMCDELRAAGLEDVRIDEHGYVYGALQGLASAPVIGLISHLDTSPEVTGTGVDPQVHTAYDGGTIALPNGGIVLDPEELPLLRRKLGHDIVTADGTTTRRSGTHRSGSASRRTRRSERVPSTWTSSGSGRGTPTPSMATRSARSRSRRSTRPPSPSPSGVARPTPERRRVSS